MNIIKKDERERIFRDAVALVGDTDFDAGSRLVRMQRFAAFVVLLMRQEGISQGRAQAAIAIAYRRIRYQRAQPVETAQSPEDERGSEIDNRPDERR